MRIDSNASSAGWLRRSSAVADACVSRRLRSIAGGQQAAFTARARTNRVEILRIFLSSAARRPGEQNFDANHRLSPARNTSLGDSSSPGRKPPPARPPGRPPRHRSGRARRGSRSGDTWCIRTAPFACASRRTAAILHYGLHMHDRLHHSPERSTRQHRLAATTRSDPNPCHIILIAALLHSRRFVSSLLARPASRKRLSNFLET